MTAKIKALFLVLFSVLISLLLCACDGERASVPETAAPQVEAAVTAPPVEIITLPDGRELGCDLTTLDLTALSDKDAAATAAVLSKFPGLKLIELGAERDDLSWESIALLSSDGRADINYSFTLYGKTFHLADTRMNLSHCEMDDNGALVRKVIACMPNLSYLDMDSCGLSDEEMAAIRDDFPMLKLVWRIWFGESYSVRTDTERILASKPSLGGTLYPDNCKALKYCTDVKYLDMGYNTLISDISFVSYMPKLEVAILGKNNWSDASPLADCQELEYLEMQNTAVSDLSPLSGLKNLKHLNICGSAGILDISPLYPLTQLERLWIGGVINISKEQVAEMQKAAPDCLINVTAAEAYEGMWRYAAVGELYPFHPRYILLMEQFGNYEEDAYSYYWNDPLY